MPQPKKNDPAPETPAPETPAPTPVPDGLATEHNQSVNDLLTLAQQLADEKEELFKRIAANREILRNFQTVKMLSADQYRSIDEFYPKVKRTPKGAATNGTDGAATPAADTATS